MRPGEHVLHGYAYDQGKLRIKAEADTVSFVLLAVIGGTSFFTPVSPEVGKRDILWCCGLMETWAPGQRPLLR